MIKVKNPKPEGGMREEEWYTGPVPRAGVWGGRKRGAEQQGTNCRLKKAEETVPLPGLSLGCWTTMDHKRVLSSQPA